ncbi:MAG TPA: hypothetical protein VFM21_11910, partial [Terriglobia bacterium]|nr:hypothetical protein [Terriglobia bacterium]
VRALGGEENYHQLKTRVMKGVIHTAGSGEAGSTEVYQAAPDKGMSSTYIPGDKPMRRGYDGAKGWFVDPDEGPQEATGDGLAPIKDEFDFFRNLRLKEIYPQMSYVGTEAFGGRTAFVTEAKHEKGGSDKFYFDTQTGLLLRHDAYAPDGGVQQTSYGDYRAVDGIQYPFRVQISDPAEFEIVIEYTAIQHDAPIDASKFAMPAQ